MRAFFTASLERTKTYASTVVFVSRRHHCVPASSTAAGLRRECENGHADSEHSDHLRGESIVRPLLPHPIRTQSTPRESCLSASFLTRPGQRFKLCLVEQKPNLTGPTNPAQLIPSDWIARKLLTWRNNKPPMAMPWICSRSSRACGPPATPVAIAEKIAHNPTKPRTVLCHARRSAVYIDN